ncbi:hypothetical protein D3C84_1229520 [compost metagenome]
MFGGTIELQGDFFELSGDIEPEALRVPFGIFLFEDLASGCVLPVGGVLGIVF